MASDPIRTLRGRYLSGAMLAETHSTCLSLIESSFFAHAHFQIYDEGEKLPADIGVHSVLKRGEGRGRKMGLWTIFHLKDVSPQVNAIYLAETSTLPPGFMGDTTQEIAEMLAMACVGRALVAVRGPVQRQYFERVGMNVVEIGLNPRYSCLKETVNCYHDVHADTSFCCFAITKEMAKYIEGYRDELQDLEVRRPPKEPNHFLDSAPDLDLFLESCSSAEAYIQSIKLKLMHQYPL